MNSEDHKDNLDEKQPPRPPAPIKKGSPIYEKLMKKLDMLKRQDSYIYPLF
jgi:hypothetical protein